MAFASAEDVATALGRDLTADEAAQVAFLLDLATGVIAAAADKSDAWAATYSPVPEILRGYAIRLALNGMTNPTGLVSTSETLGQYSNSQRFSEAGGAMTLTDLDERVIRRAVFGTNSGSAKTESLATELADLYLCCEGS
jgi:hypothetical protein